MKINEIFCSLSGEARLAGYRSIFIRTFSCNLRCSYCDSMYAVEGNDFVNMTVDEILEKIKPYECRHVVFTGGEPLLQQDAIDLIKALSENGYSVEIETNGAVDVKPVKDLMLDNVTITMDWKCPTSGMLDKMIEDNLNELDYEDVVKCVVGSKKDLEEARRINGLTFASVYLSPVFGKIELKEIADFILDNKLNDIRMQIQLHKLCWPADMRGV